MQANKLAYFMILCFNFITSYNNAKHKGKVIIEKNMTIYN